MKNRACLFALLLPLSIPAFADDDDTRMLRDGVQRQIRQYQEAEAFSDGLSDESRIDIGGETYHVPHTEHDLALGIYYAVNDRQWNKVREFLMHYRTLSSHKPHLVLMAEGLLARSQGDVSGALEKMKAAQQAAPGDVRIGLELARLYGEDNQTREAKAGFEKVLQGGMPSETKETVQNYLDILDKRSRWHGDISVGRGYSDNINQGNGKRECVGELMGECFSYRSLPKPVGSAFWQYSAAASKSVPLKGHHNLILRPIAYGSRFDRADTQSEPIEKYSDNTALLSAGYQYADADDNLTLTPYFEHYFRGGRSRYRAWGADINWERNLGRKWSVNARLEGKRVKYLESEREYYSDYSLYTSGAGLGYTFSDGLGLFGGIDLTRRKYPDAFARSREYTARIGGYKIFGNGIYLNAAALHRLSRYDEGSYHTDGERRRDRQTIFTAALGASKWQFKNISPELRFKRTVSRSNSDFYVYRQNEIALNLRYRF